MSSGGYRKTPTEVKAIKISTFLAIARDSYERISFQERELNTEAKTNIQINGTSAQPR